MTIIKFRYKTHNLVDIVLFTICFLAVGQTYSQSSSLVWLDNGMLQYDSFAMEGQTNEVNVVPDFSYAGYEGGGISIPNVPVKVTLSSSGGDDTQAIQDAIDMVEGLLPDANGFRGAVLLTAGCYKVNELFIEQSGVVLRGEGQGIDGTILYAQLQTKHDVVTVQGSGSGIDRQSASKQRITTPYVSLGTYRFEIEDASDYAVGDTIVVLRTPNQFWIDDLGMDQNTLCGSDPGCDGWTPDSYRINHERVITAISDDTITINIPIVDVMETQYGGGEVYKASVPGRIEHCGVEMLRIESYYDPLDIEDEDHAWIGVRFKRVVNSWIRNVTGEHLGYGTVSLSDESNFNTIQECATVDPISSISGGRRYSFNISDGLCNLFQRNYTRGGRHDFVTGSRVTGPNVFLDNYSTTTFADIGPHHRWATGILFDNIRGGQIRVQNRGSSGSGHGWAGNTNMFWNLLSYDEDIKVESPKGGINWGTACDGLQQNGAGFWELWNSDVNPRSLYLQQLEDRLGSSAVDNITIPEQRTGDIYDLLEAWAGELEFGEPSITQRLYVSEDAYVRGGTNGNTNYGDDDDLNIKENAGTSDNDRRSFVKFDLSQISGPIHHVILRLHVTNDPPNTAQNSVHLVTDDSWQENNITWNNQPAVSILIENKDVPMQGQWLEYDITSVVNDEINGDGVLSLRFSEATVGNLYAFASKEENGTDIDPHLTYELTDDPPPTNSCEETSLPVTWQSFTVRKEGKSAAKLDWSTSFEFNHDFFEVEWSTDGVNFNSIGKVDQAEGFQGTTSLYSYIHQTPTKGINYYRIKQIDFDQRFSFSNIQSLNFENSNSEDSFILSPNPANDQVTVIYPENLGFENAELFSIGGKLIETKPKNSSDQSIQFDLSELPRGIYLIRLGDEIQRLVKDR